MFDLNELKKPMITMAALLMLTVGTGASFAEEGTQGKVTAVDPGTGRVVEAPKMLSQMTDEEKAAYSVEDLRILELHELEMKNQAQKPKY